MVRARLAVFGGGRAARRRVRQARRGGVRVRCYASSRDGGRGDTRRLCESIRRGGTDRVIIVQQFNGHSSTEAVRGLCDHLSVPWRLVKRPSELPAVFDEWG